jgi:hypothetical protein
VEVAADDEREELGGGEGEEGGRGHGREINGSSADNWETARWRARAREYRFAERFG